MSTRTPLEVMRTIPTTKQTTVSKADTADGGQAQVLHCTIFLPTAGG
jgi:hypothetical protein